MDRNHPFSRRPSQALRSDEDRAREAAALDAEADYVALLERAKEEAEKRRLDEERDHERSVLASPAGTPLQTPRRRPESPASAPRGRPASTPLDYSKWDKLETSDDESSQGAASAESEPFSPTELRCYPCAPGAGDTPGADADDERGGASDRDDASAASSEAETVDADPGGDD